MGCGASRMEPGEEIPPGLLHFRLRIHDLKRSRTDESRRRPRERKDSIVSTTELLRPEERDIDDFEGSGEKEEANNNNNGSDGADPSAVAKGRAEQSDEEGRRIGFGREHNKAGDTIMEELPGSPSFRFYFAGVVDGLDDDSRADLNQQSLKQGGALEPIEEKEPMDRDGDNDCLVSGGEGLDVKSNRKEKGRKFMTLPKANFLNVRGCYNMNSSSQNVQEGARILSDKAT